MNVLPITKYIEAQYEIQQPKRFLSLNPNYGRGLADEDRKTIEQAVNQFNDSRQNLVCNVFFATKYQIQDDLLPSLFAPYEGVFFVVIDFILLFICIDIGLVSVPFSLLVLIVQLVKPDILGIIEVTALIGLSTLCAKAIAAQSKKIFHRATNEVVVSFHYNYETPLHFTEVSHSQAGRKSGRLEEQHKEQLPIAQPIPWPENSSRTFPKICPESYPENTPERSL